MNMLIMCALSSFFCPLFRYTTDLKHIFVYANNLENDLVLSARVLVQNGRIVKSNGAFRIIRICLYALDCFKLHEVLMWWLTMLKHASLPLLNF